MQPLKTVVAAKSTSYGSCPERWPVDALPFSRQDLEYFLHDRELPVRLYAARRLRCFGDLAAEVELVRHFSDKSSLGPAPFAILVIGISNIAKSTCPAKNYLRLVQRTREHLQLLLKASDDPDPRVRRVALVRIEETRDKRYLPVLKKTPR